MCGSPKPLYLQARRKGVATLPFSPTHRSLQMDGCGNAGLEEIKALLASNPILAAPNVGEPMLLYISATHQVVCSTRCRARGGRTQISGLEAVILRIYYPHTMQIPVPTLSKNSIRGLHGIPETTALLSRVLNHGGLQSTTQ
mgnify:CR=1 FL=1